MFEKEEFIQHLANSFIKSNEFKQIKEREMLWHTIVNEYNNAYYHSKIPKAREDLENKVVIESIKYAIKYINELMEK